MVLMEKKNRIKKYGEVFTPVSLVNEMLDKLPVDVWNNPYLKILDPANGEGQFPMEIIKRFMVGLSDWEPDIDKRYKHILENIIYVCEIQEVNMNTYISKFNGLKLNTYTGSFLESGFDKHMKEVWKIERFDYGIGNPPFTNMIDMKFIRLLYEIADVTCIVHPSTWLLDEKGKQKQFINTKELIKDHLDNIELFNGNKIFNIALFVPCVITYINKNKKTSGIKCIDKINNVEITYTDIYQINKFSNICEYYSLKRKISSITDNIDNHKIFNTSTKRNSKSGKINRYSHLNTTGEYYINISQIRGNVNLKSETNMIFYDFYTIITRDNMVSRVIDNHMFFKFSNEIESNNFLKYLKTNFVRFCLAINKNNSQLECGELQMVPWMDFTQEWTDEKLYKEFDITEDEILFIEKNIPKYY